MKCYETEYFYLTNHSPFDLPPILQNWS